MKWIDRLIAAERTGKFTFDDHVAVLDGRSCIVGEALELDKLTNDQARHKLLFFNLVQEYRLCTHEVTIGHVKEARRLWEIVQEKAGLLQEVPAK